MRILYRHSKWQKILELSEIQTRPCSMIDKYDLYSSDNEKYIGVDTASVDRKLIYF